MRCNTRITVTGIPAQACVYVVNGKSANEWVKFDKDSGNVNDANDWAIETMKSPRCPLEPLLSVVTVSLERMNSVNAPPKQAPQISFVGRRVAAVGADTLHKGFPSRPVIFRQGISAESLKHSIS